jgi:hypothetical protein
MKAELIDILIIFHLMILKHISIKRIQLLLKAKEVQLFPVIIVHYVFALHIATDSKLYGTILLII